jgi:hypothetical protein
MKKNTKSIVSVASICLTMSVMAGYAQSVSAAIIEPGSDISKIIDKILAIFSSLVPLLIGAAIVVFLYGVLTFIVKASAGNADGRKEGINFMIFGIIGIVVMMSVWGLVTFITSTLGTDTVIPQFKALSS